MTPVAPPEPCVGTGARGKASTPMMAARAGYSMQVADLRAYAGSRVRVRLDDASEHVGVLRTELLSERSLSVFLKREGGEDEEGETIYIHEIVGIWPIS